ncbi:MAG TPA: NADP-dependent phosphogluconate dehydrogenase [Candidatus Saccharimonadales bacterium]|nr:NADP-dependent phosphogluconate dehydrogenase [Candidatus Saccharimonadales bacterium]
MKIAVAGLGRMGMGVTRSLLRDGHEVLAQNRTAAKVDVAVGYGAKASYTPADVVTSFGGEQAVVWIMVPAEVVAVELDTWLKLLKPGDIVVDGGNSDFRQTKKHYDKVKAHGLELVDAGTSGGILGFDNGFSIMVGGELSAVQTLSPVFDSLSKPHGGWHHFGASGSGHFVKMVHNAIEYGMMESLAEGYGVLGEGPYKQLDLAAAGEVWQHGSVIQSLLNDLSRQALKENPTLNGIDGVVAESGEARWTLEVAKDMNLPLPAIQTSFDVRISSQQGQTNFTTKLLAAMRNKFGGHVINPDEPNHG